MRVCFARMSLETPFVSPKPFSHSSQWVTGPHWGPASGSHSSHAALVRHSPQGSRRPAGGANASLVGGVARLGKISCPTGGTAGGEQAIEWAAPWSRNWSSITTLLKKEECLPSKESIVYIKYILYIVITHKHLRVKKTLRLTSCPQRRLVIGYLARQSSRNVLRSWGARLPWYWSLSPLTCDPMQNTFRDSAGYWVSDGRQTTLLSDPHCSLFPASHFVLFITH